MLSPSVPCHAVSYYRCVNISVYRSCRSSPPSSRYDVIDVDVDVDLLSFDRRGSFVLILVRDNACKKCQIKIAMLV